MYPEQYSEPRIAGGQKHDLTFLMELLLTPELRPISNIFRLEKSQMDNEHFCFQENLGCSIILNIFTKT